MKRRILLGYQLLTGLSDGATGILLIVAPSFTLNLMGIQVPSQSLPFVSFTGVFVLSVGLACLYGAHLVRGRIDVARLEVVWLLTAVSRGLVALFVASRILSGALAPAWVSVAVSDGSFALVQMLGLYQGWLTDAI